MFVQTIMVNAMTLYEKQQAALAELEKARRASFLLKGLISDPASIAEFRKANDEVIRAAELCTMLANKLSAADSQ
jgi:hypothetical protein